MQKEKQMQEALGKFEELAKSVFQKLQDDNTKGLDDLKGQVDQVFVGRQVEAMAKEHRTRMMTTDERVAQIKNGKDGYTLSDQQTPEKFAAQKVRVTGTRDAKTKTIRVDSMTAAK